MKSGLVFSLLVSIACLQGCATITGSETQPVSLTTQHDGLIVESARCSLRNDKGAWTGTSPGFINVNRSAEDLVIECRKQGLPDGFARAISRAHGGMFGNIIFGGGIGALIDHSKGTGYEYPNTIPVRMGRSIVVDRSDQGQVKEEPVAAGNQTRAAPAASVTPPPQQAHVSANTTAPAVPTGSSSMSEIADPRYAGIQRPSSEPELAPKPPKVPPMAYEVGKLAKAHGCNSSRRAELLTEPGPIETFRVRCEAGSELIIRCEYTNCRVLN